ncbi:unnamed protein product [Tilletia controversa]|nr:unnamed protein product [Tilletia controversa]
MALDVFSCPATSVDVERLFSRAGRNLAPLRHSIRARKLAKVVAVGQWFLDDWVPADLLTNNLNHEREVKEAARMEKKRKRRLIADKTRKRQKTALEGDDEE